MGVNDVKSKAIIRNPKIACDLLNGGLLNGIQYFQPENMERLPETADIVYMDGTEGKRSAEQTPDVVYRYHTEYGSLFITFQNQKESSLIMPVREQFSSALLYHRQILERRAVNQKLGILDKGAEFLSGIKTTELLFPVIGIVFYYGEKPWRNAVELHELLSFSADLPQLKNLCPNFKLNIIHSGNADPNNFRTGLKQVFELLPLASDKKALTAYIMQNPSHFDRLNDECCDLLETFLGFHFLNKRNRRNLHDKKGGYNMCTAIYDLQKDSILMGMRIGKERGFALGEERGFALGEERGISRGSEAILALVARMADSEDCDKIPLLHKDPALRTRMLQKYQISM